MHKIHAREFLLETTEQLWATLQQRHPGRFIVVCEDGVEVETNWREVCYTSYAWDLFREYPLTPILAKHLVRTIIGKKRLSASTHLKLLGACVWSVHDVYPDVDIDILAQKVYEKTNLMYNDLTLRLEEYVSSIDLLDFIEVSQHPEILEANNNVEPTEKGIAYVYGVIVNAMNKDERLRNNPLAKAVRSSIVSMGQVNQCIGPRGFLTDTDSSQFRTPVLRGYLDGIRHIYDSLVESRSAAKSLIFSKKPLQDAEYFSRRLQLMDQIVQRLHIGDCGSTKTITWHVQGPVMDNGKEVFSGDLPRLVGKHYLDSDGKLKTIQETDAHLNGTTVHLRTVLECCHPDPYGICSTCFGEMSLSVPANSNIGHMCCAAMTQKSSQNVLSVKHLDGSASVEPVHIKMDAARFFVSSPDGMSYMLNPKLKGNVQLLVFAKQAEGLQDIFDVDEIENLNIHRVTAMSEIGLEITDQTSYENVTLNIGLERRMASMTYPLLHYIKENGWTVTEDGNFLIDLTDWDRAESMFTLPLRHYNMSDHSRDIAQMLESSVANLEKRDKVVSDSALLGELYELVNSRLNVNFAIIETVLYGVMIQSAEDGNYHLPKPWTKRGIGVREAIMSNRSVTQLMAYEGHKEAFANPMSYMLDNRPDHPLDALLMPQEVLRPEDFK